MHGLFEILDEVRIRGQRDMAQIAPRNDYRVLVNGIGRVLAQDDVSGPHGHEDKVRQAFLRTDYGHRLALGIEFYTVPSVVPFADRGA